MENREITLKLAKEFAETALSDLKSAEVELKAGIYNNSVYHSQQAVEKMIKALLIIHNLFVESHFVADLLKRTKEKIEEKVIYYAKMLERNWIVSRYPFLRKNEVWSPVKAFTEADAKDALRKAKYVCKYILTLLKKKYNIKVGE